MTDVIPAAGSPLTTGLIARPTRPARVLASFPTALYLDAGGSVVPVVTTDALVLPTAVRLPLPSTRTTWGVVAGDDVLLGDEHITLPRVTVQIRRTWRPPRVRPASHPAAATRAARHRRLELARAAASPGPSVAARPAAALARALLRQDDAAAHRAMTDLIGLGPGLTPSGDDVLAALALLTHAGERRSGPRRSGLRVTFAALRHRTTSLSASLVDAALAGYAVPQLVRLVDALLAPTRPGAADDRVSSSAAVDPGVPALAAAVARIGHHSGADLLAGLALGLRARLDHASPLERTLR